MALLIGLWRRDDLSCGETVKASPCRAGGASPPDTPARRTPRRGFPIAKRRGELPASVGLGSGFALLLFACMALAQMQGARDPREAGVTETLIAFQPPELELAPEEPPPPADEEEPPPELAEEPPQLTLDQLDLALHATAGGETGALGAGLASLGGGLAQLAEDEFVDFAQLDQIPRPIGVVGLNFPHRLLKKKAAGKIVLVLKLDADGRVLDVQVESSDLPAFDDFVAGEVRRWRFTPATRQGRPVKALARLPVPIRIS